MKNTAAVYKGEPKAKPNVTLLMSDETFQLLAAGKVGWISHFMNVTSTETLLIAQLDGQKAFMTGKLKTKGNMMFATKLDGVLKVRSYSHCECRYLLILLSRLSRPTPSYRLALCACSR